MTARPDLSILPGGALSPLRFRGLGRVGDLDLNLDLPASDRPLAVTAVLAACAEPSPGDEAIWALTLAARVGGLLGVWSEGAAADALELRLFCTVEGCGADLEVALPVPALMDLAREAEAAPVLKEGGLTLRRPTGADQRLWRGGPAGDPEEAILASLVSGAPVPDEAWAREALADKLAEFDPLPCFAVTLRCPDCDTESTLPVDLEAELLARLARVQERLFTEVDTLAHRYGWSDDVILAMPARRRARYLRIAQEGEGWM